MRAISFLFQREEKKSIFQYFQFYSCIKIVAVFYFRRNSFFTKISEHLLIESEQWFQECISSWLSSISLIDQNKTWRHHMVLTLSIIDSKQSCHSNDVILIFLAEIRTVTIKLLIWHLVFFGVDHTKLEVDRTLSKAHKQHVNYIYRIDHRISGRRYSQTNQLPIDGGHSYHELFEQKIESVLQFYKSTSFFFIYILVLLALPKKKEKKCSTQASP